MQKPSVNRQVIIQRVVESGTDTILWRVGKSDFSEPGQAVQKALLLAHSDGSDRITILLHAE